MSTNEVRGIFGLKPIDPTVLPPSARELTLGILHGVKTEEPIFSAKVYYRRPEVIVIIGDDQGREGVGWAKVCRPDKWDPEKGKEIATGRAARDLAEIIVAEKILG